MLTVNILIEHTLWLLIKYTTWERQIRWYETVRDNRAQSGFPVVRCLDNLKECSHEIERVFKTNSENLGQTFLIMENDNGKITWNGIEEIKNGTL